MKAILRRAVRRAFLRLPRRETACRVYRFLYRLLLGNDIFLSYGRRDGSSYSEALDRQLARAGLVCYSDRRGAPSGKRIPREVLFQLVNSSVLVVLAGPEAAASRNVRHEIELFRKTNRPIVPIDFGGALLTAEWFNLVENIEPEEEPRSSLKKDPPPIPGEAVVQRIIRIEETVSRRRRLREISLYTAGGILALLLAGAVAAGFIVMMAREKQLKAEGEAAKAHKDRDSARGEAVYQQRLAEAIGLANRAEALRTRDLDSLHESVRLAAESLRQISELNTTYLNADRTLRKAMELVRPCKARILAPPGVIDGAMAFSQDGRFVALCMEGIEVWGLAGKPRKVGTLADPAGTPRKVATLADPTEGCRAMAFYQRRLALAGYDSSLWTCENWDTPKPHCQKLGVYAGKLAAFSPTGGRFVAIDSAKSAQVWNLADKQENPSRVILKDLPGEILTNQPLALVGHHLAVVSFSSSATDTVHVFNTESGIEEVHFLANSIDAVALSAKENLLAASGADGIVIWDIPGRRELARLPMQMEASEDIAFSSDDRTLAIGSLDRVRLWDISSMMEIARLPGGGSDVAFSADSSSLSTRGRFPTVAVHVWDVKQNPLDAPFHQDPIYSYGTKGALSRNGRYFATATVDRVQVWEVQTGKQVIDQRSPIGIPSFLEFSPNGAYLVGDSWDKTWMVEIPTGRKVPIPLVTSSKVSFAEQGRFLAVLVPDRIEVHKTGEERARVEISVTGRPFPPEMKMSPQGRYLAMIGPDPGHSLEVWALDLGRGSRSRIAQVPLTGRLRDLAWSSDERYLAASFDGGLVVIRDAGSWPIIARLPPVADFRFDPRGEHFVAARQDGIQWVCDLRAACPSWIASYSAKPLRLALDAQGRYAAVVLEDNTTEVWDLGLRRRISHFEHGFFRIDLVFSADGRWLVGTRGDKIRRWLWRPGDLRREANRRLDQGPLFTSTPADSARAE